MQYEIIIRPKPIVEFENMEQLEAYLERHNQIPKEAKFKLSDIPCSLPTQLQSSSSGVTSHESGSAR